MAGDYVVTDVVENLKLKFQFQSQFFNPPVARNDQKHLRWINVLYKIQIDSKHFI